MNLVKDKALPAEPYQQFSYEFEPVNLVKDKALPTEPYQQFSYEFEPVNLVKDKALLTEPYQQFSFTAQSSFRQAKQPIPIKHYVIIVKNINIVKPKKGVFENSKKIFRLSNLIPIILKKSHANDPEIPAYDKTHQCAEPKHKKSPFLR